MSKAQAMFHKTFKDAKGDKSKVMGIRSALQVSCYVEVGLSGNRALTAKYTTEGEGHVQEGWMDSNTCLFR